MEQITIGQIGLAVAFLVALISGLGYLITQVKRWITKLLEAQFKEINDRIDSLQKQMENVDLESCKNYLVQFLSDVEKGAVIDEIQRERFWEQFEHYTNAGGNSYIKNKVEQLQAKNFL